MLCLPPITTSSMPSALISLDFIAVIAYPQSTPTSGSTVPANTGVLNPEVTLPVGVDVELVLLDDNLMPPSVALGPLAPEPPRTPTHPEISADVASTIILSLKCLRAIAYFHNMVLRKRILGLQPLQQARLRRQDHCARAITDIVHGRLNNLKRSWRRRGVQCRASAPHSPYVPRSTEHI
jgi:hypothetical protein